MKFRMLALILMIALTLTACSISTDNEDGQIGISTTESSSSVIKQEVRYIKQYLDYVPYNSIDDLMSESDIVVIGEVTNISFMTHDDMTYPPPEIKLDKVLCTVYDLDISNVYKGDVGDSIKLKMRGGLEDAAYTNEQVAVLGEQPVTTIPICVEEPTFEVGEKYLLVLREYEDFAGFYYPVGYYQGAYSINSTSDIFEENEESFVFSAKNVISYFGEEQWAAFKSDNRIMTE